MSAVPKPVQSQPLLFVNGEEAPFFATLSELLASRNVHSARGTAVAVNGAVIPAARWGEVRLQPGDRIEIVRPFGGG
jgi:sulfur carrier protein